jgi:hypothetical protein
MEPDFPVFFMSLTLLIDHIHLVSFLNVFVCRAYLGMGWNFRLGVLKACTERA